MLFPLIYRTCVCILGADGGLDFGTIKVSEEVKLSVNMKNKGKYEIAFK